MLSTMQAEMKVDIVELQQAEAFGALMAVFLWVYGIVSPFAGIVADRISRKKLVVGSLFVWSLVTYLMGYASSFNQLYTPEEIISSRMITSFPSTDDPRNSWATIGLRPSTTREKSRRL